MDDTRSGRLTVARRFTGPPRSGNGGYTAGLLAAAHRRAQEDAGQSVGGAVEVTLRSPPPLEVPMPLGEDDGGGTTTLRADDRLVAQARAGVLSAGPVEAVSLGEALAAETAYAGLTAHPFPTCFTCGPQREPGDGLRLFPGPVADDRTACTWTPHPSLADSSPAGTGSTVAPEYVWAALDCPGGWTADLHGRPMVLGRITAEIDAPAEVGERHVLMGRLLGHEGRKTRTTTTLYDSDGRIVARAEHVWVAVDPAQFGPA